MVETADALINEFLAAGERPTGELLQRIMALGEAAVPGLTRVLGLIKDEETPVDTVCLAALMLGQMRAVSAIPDLLSLFYTYDETYLEDVARALVLQGTPALEPMLMALQDETLGWYPRALLTEGVRDIVEAASEPELRARTTSVMRDILSRYVIAAETLTEDQVSMLSSVVCALAEMRDLQARELIKAAFSLNLVDEGTIDAAYVEDIYAGRAPAASLNAESWLERYTELLQSYQNQLKEQRARAKLGELGRNEPCWCGSGKKYKWCHMHADELERRSSA